MTRSPPKTRSRSSSSERKKREEPGIALAAGAPAKLVVDAPGLVAFGAEDVQAAEGDHFIVFGAALRGELIVDGLPLIRGNLKDFSFLLEQHHVRRRVLPSGAVGADHGGRGDVGNGQLFCRQ